MQIHIRITDGTVAKGLIELKRSQGNNYNFWVNRALKNFLKSKKILKG